MNIDEYCVACEEEVHCIQDHYENNINCLKWVILLKNNKLSNVADIIQKLYTSAQIQLKDSDTCKNCNIKYSNIGNLNKHYKKHPECLKINLYNETTIQTTQQTIYTRPYIENTQNISDDKAYYLNWPNSVYNEDLAFAKNAALYYLENFVSVGKIKENKLSPCVIFDFDDCLVFGDPASVVGVREMELGNIDGNDIFILPINKEITDIISCIKHTYNKLCIKLNVIILSARPRESMSATIANLRMFDIEYDEVIVQDTIIDGGDLDLDFKKRKFDELNNKYNIIFTIGDQENDCYINSPFSIKLPDPESKKVKIYADELESFENTFRRYLQSG